MEKFLLLFRGSDVYQPGQSPAALAALTEQMMGWLGDLVKQEKHVASEKLLRTGRQVDGMMKTITEHAFGEGKDTIGGWTIVLARDFDEAIEIAKACPILASNANIEIRPIQSV